MSAQKPAQRMFGTEPTLNDATHCSGGCVCPKPRNEDTPRVSPSVTVIGFLPNVHSSHWGSLLVYLRSEALDKRTRHCSV